MGKKIDEIDDIEELRAKARELEENVVSLRRNSGSLRKLADMTEDERNSMTAEQLEIRRVKEELEEREKTLESRITLKVRRENAISRLTGGDSEKQKKLESELAILNMPETTPEEVEAKISKAARIAGLGESGVVISGGNGVGPTNPPPKNTKFTDTERGKSTYERAFGVKLEDKK